MEVLVIVLLVLINGWFALSEIALVSVRRQVIEMKARDGDARARTVLRLLAKPAVFLSAIQTGITMIGIIAGAFGGATLAGPLADLLAGWEPLRNHAYTLALFLVVSGITYFTIVVGELVPKTIAMGQPEKVALIAAPFVDRFSRIMYPAVKLLSVSTTAILKLLPVKEHPEDPLSEEDLRSVIRTSNLRRVMERQEASARENLLRFGEHYARSLMTRRENVQWLDGTRPVSELAEQARSGARSKYPVCDGDMDRVSGTIRTRDLLERHDEPNFELKDVIQPAIIIPDTTPAYAILHIFKQDRQHIAIVQNKDRHTTGVVTLLDLTEAILGDLPEFDEAHPEIIIRNDGSFLVSGDLPIERLNEQLGALIIDPSETAAITVAEYFVMRTDHKPQEGMHFEERRFRGEIVDMDGHRIDKVLISLR